MLAEESGTASIAIDLIRARLLISCLKVTRADTLWTVLRGGGGGGGSIVHGLGSIWGGNWDIYRLPAIEKCMAEADES
jgi:hypothetical protein